MATGVSCVVGAMAADVALADGRTLRVEAKVGGAISVTETLADGTTGRRVAAE